MFVKIESYQVYRATDISLLYSIDLKLFGGDLHLWRYA